MSRRAALATAVVAVTLLGVVVPAIAEAQGANTRISVPYTGGRRPLQLDVHAGFTWFGLGAATGVRFGIPVMRNGFVPSINNAVYINFGADFYWVHEGRYDAYAPAVGLPVALHWEFYFTPRWSAFAELGINVYLHPRLIRDGDFHWSPGHWVMFAVGGRFFINDFFALTLRLGSPYASFGLSFFF